MSLQPTYWIQLSAHRLHSQSIYRAQILQGSVAIATTVQAWSENGGCGKAAAISDASRLVLALQDQDWNSAPLSTESLNSLSRQPFDSKAWVAIFWLFATWYAVIAAIGGCK